MACGIYRITNLNNGKKYIGQSRNICARWKQHTQSLDRIKEEAVTPLRHAFIKYGLKKQISSEGIFDGFKFEIICECREDELDEKEYSLINSEKPEYNIQYQLPSIDKLWPKREKFDSACYLQYHNFEKMDGYPFEGIFFENIDTTFIISKKRDALRCKGDKVYIILGMKKDGSSKKAFYLWGYTLVEEIEVTESNEYALKGCLKLCQQPQLLNNREGFENLFKKTTGSFAFGLQNVSNDIFSNQIKELCDDCKMLKNIDSDKNVYLKWLNEFESANNIIDDKTLTEIDRNNNAIVSFFRESENSSIDMELRYRAIGWAIAYPSLLIDYVNNDPEYSNIHALVCDPIIELITKFPNKKYILYSFPDEILDNRYASLKEKYNIEFKTIGT